MNEAGIRRQRGLLVGGLLCLALGIPTATLKAGTYETELAQAAVGDSSKGESSSSHGSTSAAIKANDEDYVMGPGDVLSINVWKEPDLTRVLPVRPDGKISMPLMGEIQASGLTPVKLRGVLTEKLKKYVSEPEVTVIVQEAKSQRFNIIGVVNKPGTYDLSGPTTVLDAISGAGGLQEFAKSKKIYVLRTMPDGSKQRLPFNYKAVIKGEEMSQNVQLQAGDTVVVP